MSKRRFNSKDFENNDLEKYDEKIIDLNDMKSVFREYVMMKMEKDFEEMIKKYFENKDEFNIKF